MPAPCSRSRGVHVQPVRTYWDTAGLCARRRISPLSSFFAPHYFRGNMLGHALITIIHLQATRSLLAWTRRVGGPGLIVLGVLDNSAIPLPGSQDAMVILLAASEKTWWPYYALMATAGAVLGGYITYRLARQEGKA